MKKLHLTLDLYQETLTGKSKEIIIKGIPDLVLGESLFIFSHTKVIKVFITGLTVLNNNPLEIMLAKDIETKISFVIQGSTKAIAKAA